MVNPSSPSRGTTVEYRDPAFPRLLKEIAHPPERLFCRGNLQLLSEEQCVALVGTRRATSYGKAVVHKIVPELVQAGLVTVSGLAFGIDQAVHEETLKASGKTIAVLGSPLETGEIVPAANSRLAEDIVAQGGLLLSEYPSGTIVRPSFFPTRNRIIAGFSIATIVVEAPRKSGALITARLALESNREVFAVPGSLFSRASEGTNWLIAQGARPWFSLASLSTELPSLNVETKPQQGLSPAETVIFKLFSSEPMTIDEAIEQTAMAPPEVIRIVTSLLCKELLRDIGDQRYISLTNTL